MIPSTCSLSSSSLNALPGPLSSMQWRQARLHSLVICQATYRGAPRSPVLLAAEVDSTASAAATLATRRILHQPLRAKLRQQGRDFSLDRSGGIVEAVFQTRCDLAFVAARLDLAH